MNLATQYDTRLQQVEYACREIVDLGTKLNASLIALEGAAVAGSLHGIERAVIDIGARSEAIRNLSAAVLNGARGFDATGRKVR